MRNYWLVSYANQTLKTDQIYLKNVSVMQIMVICSILNFQNPTRSSKENDEREN